MTEANKRKQSDPKIYGQKSGSKREIYNNTSKKNNKSILPYT